MSNKTKIVDSKYSPVVPGFYVDDSLDREDINLDSLTEESTFLSIPENG